MIQPARFPKGNSKIRRIFDLANLENDTEKREKTERGSAKIRLKGWGARKRSEDNGDVIDSQIRRVKRREW